MTSSVPLPFTPPSPSTPRASMLCFTTLLCHSASPLSAHRSPIFLYLPPNPQTLPLSSYPYLTPLYISLPRLPVSLFHELLVICLFVCLIPSPFLSFDSSRVFVWLCECARQGMYPANLPPRRFSPVIEFKCRFMGLHAHGPRSRNHRPIIPRS